MDCSESVKSRGMRDRSLTPQPLSRDRPKLQPRTLFMQGKDRELGVSYTKDLGKLHPRQREVFVDTVSIKSFLGGISFR